MEEFAIRGWARRILEPWSITYRPMRVGFPHRTGGVSTLGVAVLFPVDRKSLRDMEGFCRDIEIFFIGGWDPIPPGRGGTSMALFSSNLGRKTQWRLAWSWSTNQQAKV